MFLNESEANAFIQLLDDARGEHWADPAVNLFDGRAIVPWNDEYLKDQEKMLKGLETISRLEAEEQGWPLGYFKGPFAKARTKLEDAMFARDSLDVFDNYPNFPAYRAIFYGTLAALYGVKEALRWACKKLGAEPSAWWDVKHKELEGDPFLFAFYNLHNADKHALEAGPLQPKVKCFGYQGPKPDVISGEGVFSIIHKGTQNERRAFHSGVDAQFECYLNLGQLLHHGQDVSNLPLKNQIDLVLEHYKKLVWEARTRFSDEPKLLQP